MFTYFIDIYTKYANIYLSVYINWRIFYMRFKKLAALAVSSLMTISMSIPAFAADLNSNESSIISKLQSCNVPVSYITQARNYFLLDDVDITADQAANINAHIQTARSIAGSATTVSQLTADQKRDVVDELASAASSIGLTVAYNSSTDTVIITKGKTVILESVGGNIVSGVQPDTNNQEININNNNNNNNVNNNTNNNSGSTTSKDGVIKQTGGNIYLTYGVIGALTAALLACGVVAAKKSSSEKEA